MRRFVCSCGVTLAVVYVFLVGSGPASGQPLQDRLEKPLSEKTPAVPKQAIDVLRTTVGELGPLFTAWMTQSVYLPPMSLRAQLPETFYKTPILPPIPPGKKHTCEEAPDQETILLCLPEPRGIPWIYEEHWDDVTTVCEKIADVVDPVRMYPQVGPAQLHHCHWKCTIDFTERKTLWFGSETRQRHRTEIVYINLDHLHLYWFSRNWKTAFSWVSWLRMRSQLLPEVPL